METEILEEIEGKIVDLKLSKFVPAVPEKHYVDICCYDILLSGTDIVVGECSAKIGFNESIFYIGNVGYAINEELRGNGYAVEAVKLLLKLFRINNFKSIIITQNPQNKASFRVCEKLSAKFLGTYSIPEYNIRREKFGERFMNVWELKI